MTCPGRSLEQRGWIGRACWHIGTLSLRLIPRVRRPSFLAGARVASEVVELFTVPDSKGGVEVAVVEASIEPSSK